MDERGEDTLQDPSGPEGGGPRQEPFVALLERMTPRVWITPALIGANGLVFLAMVLSGVHFFSPSVDSLLKWGADYGPRVTTGQWWRLFTSMFLHIGILHILFNMLVLWNIGRFVERLVGNLGFLGIYMVSGLAGSVASIWWSPFQVSAGASGAIFGLYGFMLGYLIRNRSAIPSAELQKLIRGALVFVGYNLVYGAAVPGIDMAAHLGGLLGGFAFGLAISHPPSVEGAARPAPAALTASLAGAALLMAVALSLPKVVDLQAELNRFDVVEARVIDTYNRSVQQSHEGQLSDKAFAKVIGSEILPEWQQCRRRLAQLHGLPKAQAEFLARLGQYMAVREESWSLLATALDSEDVALANRAHLRQLEAERLLGELKGKG